MAKTRLNTNLRYKIRNKVIPTIVVEEETHEQVAFRRMSEQMRKFLAENGPSASEVPVLNKFGAMVEIREFGHYALPNRAPAGVRLNDGLEALDVTSRRRVVTVYAAPRDMRRVRGLYRDDVSDGRTGGCFYVPRGWTPMLPDRLIDAVEAYYDAMIATNVAMLTARRAFTSVLNKARTVEALVEAFPPCAELVEEFKHTPPAPVDTAVLGRCKVVKQVVDDDGDDA